MPEETPDSGTEEAAASPSKQEDAQAKAGKGERTGEGDAKPAAGAAPQSASEPEEPPNKVAEWAVALALMALLAAFLIGFVLFMKGAF